MIDAYTALGVGPEATGAELKAAHRRLARRHHPDLVAPAERDAATRRVQEVNVAYGLVRDPAARARYDRLRTAGPGAAPSERDALLTAAGRWAGRWWRRWRVPLRAGAARAALAARRAGAAGRRAAVDVAGRAVWLLCCVLGAVLGWLLATAAQHVAGATGPWATLAGTLGGLLVGSSRGWWWRLRLAGIPASQRRPRAATALWVVAVAAGLWLDLRPW